MHFGGGCHIGGGLVGGGGGGGRGGFDDIGDAASILTDSETTLNFSLAGLKAEDWGCVLHFGCHDGRYRYVGEDLCVFCVY